MESQTNVVYKIPCTNCSWCYIGETGRAFNTRKKEHFRNTKIAAKGSKIANHAWSNNYTIDFDNSLIIDKGTFRARKTLEAWHTRVTPNADNNSCPLPAHYNILFNKNIHNYIHFYYFAFALLFKFSHRFLFIHFTRRRLQFGQSKARTF